MIIVKYFNLCWNKAGQLGMAGGKKAEKKEREDQLPF